MEFIVSVSGNKLKCVIELKNEATNEYMVHYLSYDDTQELVDALNHILDYEMEDEDDQV